MLAMRLHAAGEPLREDEVPVPEPREGEVLVRVRACGVCRTDLHIVDGELAASAWPVTPGHEVVGEVAASGPKAGRFDLGERVGIPWLGGTCGRCAFCARDRENLCDAPRFTGLDRPGGYAAYTVADARYCVRLPGGYDDVAAAPLLCAGLIGYRAYAMAGDARVLGIYGFGAAAHIIAQVAVAQGRTVFAFTRAGDEASRHFARGLGCAWAGASGDHPPDLLDAALIFAPVGALVPAALGVVRKGGVVVCAGIHMSAIPSFDYSLLWGERAVRSVANLTRRDGAEFMRIAATLPIRTHTTPYPLARANEALFHLRHGRLQGAAVLVP
ncbi:MAG: zinc-dependent alcohol dehydrogenase family protein [Betaproteobacteria bacterium]